MVAVLGTVYYSKPLFVSVLSMGFAQKQELAVSESQTTEQIPLEHSKSLRNSDNEFFFLQTQLVP